MERRAVPKMRPVVMLQLVILIASFDLRTDCLKSNHQKLLKKGNKKQQRMIVACCGRKSCIDLVSRSRLNSSTTQQATTRTTLSVKIFSTSVIEQTTPTMGSTPAATLKTEDTTIAPQSTFEATPSSSITSDTTTMGASAIDVPSLNLTTSTTFEVTTSTTLVSTESATVVSSTSTASPSTTLAASSTITPEPNSSTYPTSPSTTTKTTSTSPTPTTTVNIQKPTTQTTQAAKANWEQNAAACCRLGMTPITFETESKARCFENFINGPKWAFNSRYWTSGLRAAGSKFNWCQRNGGEVAPILWDVGQPTYENDTDNCAQMVIEKRNSTVRLDDRHCGVVSAFACQGPTTPPPPCIAPVCPNVTCTKNMNFYKVAKDNTTSYLIDPNAHGTWVMTDKSFLFSHDNKTFIESLQACCEVGMKLLSLHLDHKFRSVSVALASGGVTGGQFWTSGTDLGCEDSFGYCTSNRLVRQEAQWKRGQPDNLNGKENCLVVEVSNSTSQLLDYDCNEHRRFICEGNLKSGVEIVEKECAMAFDLSPVQVKKLLTSFPENLPQKCFLKCFGEGTEMFVNGKLLENKIMAQFASLAGGDVSKLMDMYSTLNFCSNTTRGMDACDKAAKLLECGKENSPDAVASLMTNIENAFTEAPVVFPPDKGLCPTEFKCLIDETRKAVMDAATDKTQIPAMKGILGGKVTIACGGKKYFFLQASDVLPLAQAMELCCSFGLRMLTVETHEEFVCLNNADALYVQGSHAVAASRMEYLSRPAWCFTGQLFNMSWFPSPVTNTNNGDIYIYVQFSNPPMWEPFGSAIRTMACESV